MTNRSRVYDIVYLTRNGLLEPLGQSQVFAYLRALARDYRIILITREKPEDWADSAAMAAARARCAGLGIDWRPQRFRGRPRFLGALLDVLGMLSQVVGAVRRDGVRLVHARSYVPAAIALVVNRLTRTPFIFDMRALWPEELITAGRLRRGSLLHSAIVGAEQACLQRAAAVISLTHAAADHLRQVYPAALRGQQVAVIPTCADLDRFTPAAAGLQSRTIGCLGTVLSGWFRLDWLVAFLTVALRRDPALQVELTTRDDPQRLREALGSELQQRVRIAAAAPDEVPAILRQQVASVMFFTDGLGKLGSSPTRMGEILGCGLPVVANAGVGDVARIIRTYGVGVIAEGPAPEQMERAYDALVALLADPELPARCRRAAEEVFSLAAGTEAYRRVYAEAIGAPAPERVMA